jgi:hypothetical protein
MSNVSWFFLFCLRPYVIKNVFALVNNGNIIDHIDGKQLPCLFVVLSRGIFFSISEWNSEYKFKIKTFNIYQYWIFMLYFLRVHTSKFWYKSMQVNLNYSIIESNPKTQFAKYWNTEKNFEGYNIWQRSSITNKRF